MCVWAYVQNAKLDKERTYSGKLMLDKYCTIMNPGFAVSTHFKELCRPSPSITSDSPCYVESEVSANEIFKHLKSLKTNLPNVLPFPIKGSVCNYIRPVITRFHDLSCNWEERLCIPPCLCVIHVCVFICDTYLLCTNVLPACVYICVCFLLAIGLKTR